MVSFKSLAVAILGIGIAIQEACALSQHRNPLRRITQIESPKIHAPRGRVHAYSDFELTFYLRDNDQQIRLVLHPNPNILDEFAQINILNPDGTLKTTKDVVRTDHKIYKGDAFVQRQGTTEWAKAGWARISVHTDGTQPIFEGAFRLANDHHHIQTSKNYRRTKHRADPSITLSTSEYMVVWRDSDIMKQLPGSSELKKRDSDHHSCLSDTMEFNSNPEHPVYKGISEASEVVLGKDGTTPWWGFAASTIFKRQDTLGGNGNVESLVSTIGSTDGCPTTRKIALVGIATDCTYTAAFSSEDEVRANVIDIVNSASQVYEDTFNIALGIQNLTITDSSCPETASEAAPWNVNCNTDITSRLNLFSEWRGRSIDTNAYWTLMSTCSTGSAVGLAWLGQLCVEGSASSSDNETIAGANVVVRTEGGGSEWQVFAHETGHTFGAVHDCTDDSCDAGLDQVQSCCPLSSSTCDAGGDFIMNPSTGDGITSFSQCTVGNVCTAMLMNSVSDRCLTSNRDVPTITGDQCGNGIVETGEDCDCGGESGCEDNPCCDPTTCKFTEGSSCDFSNEECCTDSCQIASAGTVCRASTGSCDPEETCSGTSPTCPDDELEEDGASCGDGLHCASGQCTSRDLQCRSFLGADLTDNDTYACSGGCTMTCHSDTLLPAQYDCYSMMQYFLDGTPCTGGGTCQNGQCLGSNVVEELGDWLSQNKNIVIPVAAVVGSLILIAILSCCINSWRRSRRAKHAPKPPMLPPQNSWTMYGGAWRGPTTPHQARSTPRSGTRRPGASRSQSRRDRSQDLETREPMLPTQPQGPPPQYTPYAGGANWHPSRQQSVRYA